MRLVQEFKKSISVLFAHMFLAISIIYAGSSGQYATIMYDGLVIVVPVQDKTAPDKPVIGGTLPNQTDNNTIDVEVHGEPGTDVYANEVKVGTIGANGTVIVHIALVNGINAITITLKDKSGNESEGVDFSVIYTGIGAELNQTVALRFLNRATFGASIKEVNRLQKIGINTWLDEQLNAPSAYDSDSDDQLTYTERMIQIAKMADPNKWPHSIEEYLTENNGIIFNQEFGTFHPMFYFNSTWFENALNGKDQLRQRVAFALSQLVVVSTAEKLLNRHWEAFAYYCDTLAKHAFGNYRNLLLSITKSPAMGVYLTYQGNKKYDPATKRQPDENYAREVMQLFSLGLYKLNLDGTEKHDSNGKKIPTYTQKDVEEMARVFTGWDHRENNRYGAQKARGSGCGSYLEDMEFTLEYHDDENKTVFGTFIPGGNGEHDIEAAIDILMQHDNIAPFVSKFLIQRLVTSNPTPAYVERVARVFNDNGNGVKGDLKAVIRAILLDNEALQGETVNTHFARYKEPLIAYLQLLRTFDVDYAPTWSSRWIFGSDQNMTDVYYFDTNDIYAAFGQASMRSPSVFNFYSPDYVPNDDHFKNNNLVAPEMQIQSAQMMINYSNYLFKRLDVNEKLRGSVNMHSRFLISFIPEKEVVMKELQEYKNIENSTYKEKAIDALLAHLNLKMTGGEIDTAQLDKIKNYLRTTAYSKNLNGVRKMIRDAVYAIATSSTYMIQR